MKPTPEINDLQSLHGQFSGFHSRILFLNRLRVFRIFMLFGIFCQIFGPMCLRLSVPQDTVLTLLVIKIFWFGYLNLFSKGNTSFMISGDILLATLYNSMASVWILRSCIVKELSFSKSSSKEERLSFYTKQSPFSFSLLKSHIITYS